MLLDPDKISGDVVNSEPSKISETKINLFLMKFFYTERSFVIECVIKNQLHGITQCNNVIAWIYYTFNYDL